MEKGPEETTQWNGSEDGKIGREEVIDVVFGEKFEEQIEPE